MHAVPEEAEGREAGEERREDARCAGRGRRDGCALSRRPALPPLPARTVVVEVLDRVHAEAGEGLDVRVPVVERVDLLVERLEVEEPVRKVEVDAVDEGVVRGVVGASSSGGDGHAHLLQTGTPMSAATKRRRPAVLPKDSASEMYGRRPVAQRYAKTLSKAVQRRTAETVQKTLCATLFTLYGRSLMKGRLDHPKPPKSDVCQKAT